MGSSRGGDGTGEEDSPTLSESVWGGGGGDADEFGALPFLPSASVSGPRRRRYSLVGSITGAGVGGGGAGSNPNPLAMRRTQTIEDDGRSILSFGGVSGARVPGRISAAESMMRVRGMMSSRKHWMEDDSTMRCSACSKRFTLLFRKHHCRLCGHIFCDACSSLRTKARERVCQPCHAAWLKALERSESRQKDDVASLKASFRGPLPHAAPLGALCHSPLGGSGGGHGASFSRPSSLYQSQSHLRRPLTPGGPHEDHISEGGSGSMSAPASPVTPALGADGAAGEAEDGPPQRSFSAPAVAAAVPKSTPVSPKTDLAARQEQQQRSVHAAEGSVAGAGKGARSESGVSRVSGSRAGAGGASAAGAEDVQSPTLSAVPFRKEIGEDDDEHGTQVGEHEDGQEGESEDERKDGLGIHLVVTGEGEEPKGLGLDLGEDVKFDAPPDPQPSASASAGRKSPPPHPATLSTPVQASPHSAAGSRFLHDLPDLPGSRNSPSAPHFDRSTSRLSLIEREPGFTLFPFDVAETDPHAYHAAAFEVAEETVIPLSPAALEHIRRMIRQSLEREEVPHAKAWAVEIERLLLDVADRLSALPHRAVGDDLDVRQYVRVKRIPGGRPKDSEFVSGVVITKNLMHREMPRTMHNPKVMLLSIPLDFERDNQLYSMDTVVAQADQAVDKLVERVHHFFPDLLLVEKAVSQHALRLLREKDISAARHVKHSSLTAVARALGSDIVTSIGELSDHSLGGLEGNIRPLRLVARCQTFRVQTFVHPLIPGGRKTFLRFEGDDHHKPCTLILRGEDLDTLAKIKRIVNMLVLVVYNAKLEGYLLHDQQLEVLPSAPSSSSSPLKSTSPANAVSALDGVALPPPPIQQQFTSQQIAATLAPYETAALSGSALVHYPPPYPLARMADEDRKIRELRVQRETEETQRIIDEEAASRAQSVSGASSSATSVHSASAPSSPTGEPSRLMQHTLLADAAALARRPSRDVMQRPEELVKQTVFVEAEERHKQHLAAWEAYCKTNEDSFDPVDYQQLFVLESLLLCDTEKGEPNRLCRPHEVKAIAFYGQGDRTIGAFLREADVAQRTSEACPSPSCHEALARHLRTYVHDNSIVRISSEPFNNDVLFGNVGMSSECLREGCDCAGRLVLVANETTRLSFAKFLELCFYPSERIACADEACGHDAQRDHVRYWHFGSVRVSIRMDKIDLRDVVAPPRHVKVRPDRQLELRNAEYEEVLRRSEAFFDSVQDRIRAFKFDCVMPERIEECKAALFEFSGRCEAERKAVGRLLKSTYEHAHDSNGTEMSVVRRALQEKSHAFDADWTAFAKKIMPADAADMRRASATQLRRILPEVAAGLAVSPRRSTSSQLSPALEIDEHAAESEESAISPTSSEGSSLFPLDSASAQDGDDASSVLSAEIRIEPPSMHVADGSIDSTATVLPSDPAVSSNNSAGLPSPVPSASVPPAPQPRSPRPPRSPASYRPQVALEESDLDSDSTVCADGEPAAPATRNTSPFIRRHIPPVQAETSAAESEAENVPFWQRRSKGGHVASVVETLEQAASLGKSSSSKRHVGSPARPGMRRAHTDKPSGSVKSRSSTRPPIVVSDSDSFYARNVGVSHLLDHRLSAAAARPTRIPARTVPMTKAHTLAGAFEPLSPDELGSPVVSGRGMSLSPSSSRAPSRASSRPPSRPASRPSSRPISPVSTRSRPISPISARSRLPVSITEPSTVNAAEGNLSRPPLSRFSSSRSTIKGKSVRRAPQSESSDAGKPLQPTVARTSTLHRPTASSASKVTARRVVSTGTGRKVDNLRRHWDSVAVANEKREAAYRRRARPIITTQPTLTVFDNIRDAIKVEDDSEDEHDAASSGGESAGADDEFDDVEDQADREEDGGQGAERTAVALTRETTLRPTEPTPRPAMPATLSMSDALVRSVSVASLEPTAMLLPRPSSQPPAHEQLSRSVEPSDRDFASIPTSPHVPDSFTFPRMSEGESSGTDRRSIFNAFSSLWNYRNGDFSPLAYPTIPTEHVYADNPVILRDDEPTSIIAHALSSKKYYQATATTDLPRIREGLTHHKAESVSGEKKELSPDPELAKTIEDILRASTQRSFKLEDVELGDISARCTVFWVEQFEALRRQCGCDTQFVESLSRCFKWDAAGDDRFIVKQLSKPEMEVFARFAPAYFQYMADALFQGKPTVLAKVFGIYRISLGKHYRNVDFLVMENLFYGRQLKQIFDLKGSTRNRRAEENNPVLLDENLLELSLKNPFYVREESKQFIKQAIYNDSQFLSDLNVMDYSLVVGVDAVNAELCMGIVDYIRTYTWDKRIESWVKETTFLGSGSKSGGPTVITPKQYRMRFREAIDGYLLLSPTPWLNPRTLLPVANDDPPSKQYGIAQDAASFLFGSNGGGERSNWRHELSTAGSTVPPTPSSVHTSAFAAPSML
ncbi:Mitochondrial distribution and morphology protein 12 [Rhodosporidiobolus nylandii]